MLINTQNDTGNSFYAAAGVFLYITSNILSTLKMFGFEVYWNQTEWACQYNSLGTYQNIIFDH